MITSALLLFASLGLAQGSAVSERASIRLDNEWLALTTPHRSDPPTEGRWEPTPVPGFFRYNPRGGSKDVWFRRKLAVPKAWSGRRIVLHMKAARYAPKVFIDGRAVAERLNGWSPFEVDVTPFIQPGSTHELMVRCQDYGATFAEGTVWPSSQGEEAIRGKVLAPIGGYKDTMGLIDPVFLRSTPKNRIVESELTVRTSVRRGEITVIGASEGTGSKVLAEVLSGGNKVLSLPSASGRKWTIRAPFPKARYWSPEDPHLYQLRLTLVDDGGKVLDRFTQRFGFREIWTDGPDFFLNGVKRRLFAASTWPVQEWLDPKVVRERLEGVKASGVDTFRFHVSPWQQEFVDIADEVGVMVVEEAAVYTDRGSYAYTDERYWKNYRDHLAGMVHRGRNNPSVILWSLGNEVLFMGNEQFDPDLPKKLGSLSTFVKSIDPTRPTTFEADIDPDGKYDVVGLHYPHELPNVYAYPEAADWMGTRKLTEAGGGMLGTRRTGFLWDRKKPLYIGEYLWVPVADYSPGSVFFGDEAYINREATTNEARAQSWIDQTIAYRRAGVSALCPWAVFEFGAAPARQLYLDAQSVFFKRQMAWLRDRGLRFFSEEKAKLRFDVFNDGLKPAKMVLQLLVGGNVVQQMRLELPVAGYADVSLTYPAPKVARQTKAAFTIRLSADGKVVDESRYDAEVFPMLPLTTSHIVFDPSGKWPGSQKTIPTDGKGVVLVVAPGALDTQPRADGLPVVGGSQFDAGKFRRFLESGGRCVVLEQENLSALGFGVVLVDHASTMTFPLDPDHPVLQGLRPEDIRHWRGDGYVSRKEIRRDGSGGLRAVTVSGGPESLAQAPIAEMGVGKGHVVFVQALAGSKRTVDPAARKLLQNVLGYLAGLPEPDTKTVSVVATTPGYAETLQDAGLKAIALGRALSTDDVAGLSGVVLEGGGDWVVGSRDALLEAVRREIPIYWSRPTKEAFEALKGVLGADQLAFQELQAGPSLAARDHQLLRGVSREDLVFTTRPLGWDRIISYKTDIATGSVVASESAGEPELKVAPSRMRVDAGRIVAIDGQTAVRFDRIGNVSFDVSLPEGGTRLVTLDGEGMPEGGQRPTLELRIDGRSVTRIELQEGWGETVVPLDFPKGTSRLSLHFVNGARWGGELGLSLRGVTISKPLSYPKGFNLLAAPGAIVSFKAGSTVVLDSLDWTKAPEDRIRGFRYLVPLLSNLGMPFESRNANLGDVLPNARFVTEGGRYNTADASRIELRSTGHAEIEFVVGRAGDYGLVLVGHSTPADGEYARVDATVDGREAGSETFGSNIDATYRLGPIRLEAGKHRLRLAFPNDASNEREDRNLVIRQVAFAPAD